MQAASIPHMCSYVFYYSAAYMLITHMQATSISHMACIHVYYYVQYRQYMQLHCAAGLLTLCSSFILSSYRVSFVQLGRDSLRDKEIEMNSWGIQKNWYLPQVCCTQAHEVCSLHVCILCRAVASGPAGPVLAGPLFVTSAQLI